MVWFYMVLLRFEYYVSKGLVKRRRKNIKLAKSLMSSALDRMEFAKQILQTKPKYALEMAYEAVIELIDALLALEGFKSWSHEANIAFLSTIGFSDVELRRLDITRKKRHSSKYYGVDFSLEEASQEIVYIERLFKKVLASSLICFLNC